MRDGEPLLLLARGGRARGTLPLPEEPAARAAAPRTAARPEVTLLSLRAGEGEPLQARVARARPRRRHRRVGVSLDIDPTTPPGEYQGELELEGVRTPVQLVVPQRHRFRLVPSRLTFEVTGACRAQAQVLVENRGNVDVVIEQPAAALIEPRNRACIVMRDALAAAGGAEAEPTAQRLVDTVVAATMRSTGSDPTLGARIEQAPCTLRPGERRMLDLTLRIAATPRGNHRAVLSIAGRGLRVDIVSHMKGPDESEES